MPRNWGHQAVIDDTEAHINAGRVFEVAAVGSAVANGGVHSVLIRVASGHSMHALLEVDVSGNWLSKLYEGVGFNAASAGVGLTPQNRNRLSQRTVAASFMLNAAVGSFGTRLEDQAIFAGGGGNAGGAARSERGDWYLAGGKDYLFEVTNVAGTAQSCFTHILFYEEESE